MCSIVTSNIVTDEMSEERSATAATLGEMVCVIMHA